MKLVLRLSSSFLIACVAMTLAAAPAHAQLGGLKKLKNKVKDQIEKQTGGQAADSAARSPAGTTAGAGNASPGAAAVAGGAPDNAVASSGSAPARNNNYSWVPAYPGATLIVQADRCCEFTTTDPISKVVAYYDEKLGTKGRDLDEMVKRYPADWTAQADGYRKQVPGMQTYTYLYDDDKPIGRQFQVMAHPRQGIWMEIPIRELAGMSPEVLRQWLREKRHIEPVSAAAVVTSNAAESVPPPDEAPASDAEKRLTQDLLNRFISAEKSWATSSRRLEKQNDQEMNRRSAVFEDCFNKLKQTPEGFDLQNPAASEFVQEFCGMRYQSPPSYADIIAYRKVAKAAGLKSDQWAFFREHLVAYQTARCNGGRPLRGSWGAFSAAEVDLIERNWAAIEAVLGGCPT